MQDAMSFNVFTTYSPKHPLYELSIVSMVEYLSTQTYLSLHYTSDYYCYKLHSSM